MQNLKLVRSKRKFVELNALYEDRLKYAIHYIKK